MPKCSPETNPDCSSCGGMPWCNLSMLLHMTKNSAKKSSLLWQTTRCSEVSEVSEVGKDCKSLLVFLHKGHHFTFEKADLKNSTKWFDEAYPKWGKCMDAHAAMTYPTFTWDNYYAWKVSKNYLDNEALDEGFDTYKAMLTGVSVSIH